jgi:hypothetical protein
MSMREAHPFEIEGVPIRVVRADHLAAIALSTGRPKDFARVLSLLDSGAVTQAQLESLADRHGLSIAWRRFKSRFLE